MDMIHIALASLTHQVTMNELQQVAAALQTQATRDFGPIWGVAATVDAFPCDQIPAGYLPIIVQDSLDQPGAAGYHQTQGDGTPYALVLYGESWSLTASHECLEMLADPYGSRKHTGPSLIDGQGCVDYVLEICDPCQAPAFAYAVNGIMVSDFCTPRYFDAMVAPHGRYSFSGAVQRPLQILPGGYLSWFANDGQIYQACTDARGGTAFAGGLSAATRNGRPLREFIDSLDPYYQQALSKAPWSPALAAARMHARSARDSHSAKFRHDIEQRFGNVRM